MRVDRVVAQGPEDAPEIEQYRWPGEGTGDRGPAEEGAPVEVEPKKQLRPPGDALHEGVGADQSQDADSEPPAQGFEAEQHRGADRELYRHEDDRLPDADPAARQRTPQGPLDLAVILAVGDVVQRAAGAAHCDGADREQQQQHRVGPSRPSQRNAPPAREQQEPSADRPVPSRQPRIRLRPPRQPAIGPIPLANVARIFCGARYGFSRDKAHPLILCLQPGRLKPAARSFDWPKTPPRASIFRSPWQNAPRSRSMRRSRIGYAMYCGSAPARRSRPLTSATASGCAGSSRRAAAARPSFPNGNSRAPRPSRICGSSSRRSSARGSTGSSRRRASLAPRRSSRSGRSARNPSVSTASG